MAHVTLGQKSLETPVLDSTMRNTGKVRCDHIFTNICVTSYHSAAFPVGFSGNLLRVAQRYLFHQENM